MNQQHLSIHIPTNKAIGRIKIEHKRETEYVERPCSVECMVPPKVVKSVPAAAQADKAPKTGEVFEVDEVPGSKATIPFQFFDLPAELRQQIYALCLVSPEDIQFCGVVPVSMFIKYNLNLALLQTSHRVYDEAASVLYGQNTFLFHSRDGFDATDQAWLSFLNFMERCSKAKYLRKLKFDVRELFDRPSTRSFALSGAAHAALRAVRNLPDLQLTTLVIHTHLPARSLSLVAMVCRALRDTPCLLELHRPNCAVHHGWHFCTHLIPNVHQTVLSKFIESGWRLLNDFDVIDSPDPLPYECDLNTNGPTALWTFASNSNLRTYL